MKIGNLVLALGIGGLVVGLGLGDAEADWKKTRNGKAALKERPENHPKGAPWIELWSDSTPSNIPTPLKPKLKKKNENKTCNGLDDNKNGKIDEKCGFKTGPFQAVLSWDTTSNLDIQVIYSPWDAARVTYDGGGTRVTHGYGDSKDNSVGYIGEGRKKRELSVSTNAEGTCSCNARYVNGKITKKRKACKVQQGTLWAEEKHYVENVWLDGDEALPGIYKISFYNKGNCEPFNRKQVVAQLAVAVNGKLLGYWKTGDLGPQGFSFPILTVYVPPKD